MIEPDFITRKSADKLLAFHGKYGVPVEIFYYIRHRKRLRYPDLPCIAVKILGRNGTTTSHTFYPLEVLGVVIKDEKKIDASVQTASEEIEQMAL